MSLTGNNIAAALRRREVAPRVAALAGEYLADQYFLPCQIRTALRCEGLTYEPIAEAIEAAEINVRLADQ